MRQSSPKIMMQPNTCMRACIWIFKIHLLRGLFYMIPIRRSLNSEMGMSLRLILHHFQIYLGKAMWAPCRVNVCTCNRSSLNEEYISKACPESKGLDFTTLFQNNEFAKWLNGTWIREYDVESFVSMLWMRLIATCLMEKFGSLVN